MSLTISESIPTWPGDLSPKLTRTQKLEEGDMVNVTHISLSAHTGTHVDAPCHFLKEGYGVEKLPLEVLVGPALVIELSDVNLLTKKVFESVTFPPNTERLLIKTRNSKQWTKGATTFDDSYVAISADGAEYLVEKGIRLVGVDYLSVASQEDMVATHQLLLKSEVVVVEGLNLSEVPPGEYTLCCLPLKIAHSDGAPTRAILMQSR